MKVEFSKKSEVDLEAIGDWVAQENPERAGTFIAELRLECRTLAVLSERIPFLRVLNLVQSDERFTVAT